MPGALDMVTDYFASRSLPLTVLPSLQGQGLTDALNGLPADARILSLGGDGTLNGVIQASCNTQRTVGVLPAGSADDFATALGFPRDDLTPALDAIRLGRSRLVDTGKANLILASGEHVSRRFVNALGTGFDAEVAAQRETKLNWIKGDAGYYTALALSWFRLLRRHLTVYAGGSSDEPVWSDRALLVSCQNSSRTGGSFYFAPEAKIDDGVMNLLVAGNVGHFELLGLLPKVLKALPLVHPKVFSSSGTSFTLRWDRPRTLHMDGELVSEVRQAQVTVDPASLRIFAP